MAMSAIAKLRPFFLSSALLVGGSLIAATPARANSWPPMAVSLFYLPLVASIISFGLGFVLIVGFEGWTLSRREKLPFWPCIGMVFGANFWSSLAGIGFVLCLSALPYLHLGLRLDRGLLSFTITLLLLAIVLLSLGWCTARALKRLTRWWSGHFLLWSLVWVAVLYGEVFLVGWIYALNPAAVVNRSFPDWQVPFYVNVLQLLAGVTYFAVGFGLSLVVEGFWLGRCLPQATATLGKTLLIMNVRSYCYIVIPVTIFLFLLKP